MVCHMKKLILSLTMAAFAAGTAFAGDAPCCAEKTSTAADKSCCPMMTSTKGKKMQTTKAGACPFSKENMAKIKKQSSPKELASR